MKSHCDSAKRRSSLGRAGGCRGGDWEGVGIWGSVTACILMMSAEPAYEKCSVMKEVGKGK